MRHQHMHEFIRIHYDWELCRKKPRSLSIVQTPEHLWTSSCSYAVPQKRSRFVRGFRGTSHGENSCGLCSGDHANQAHWGAKARDFGNQEEDQGLYGRNVASQLIMRMLSCEHTQVPGVGLYASQDPSTKIIQNWLRSAIARSYCTLFQGRGQ